MLGDIFNLRGFYIWHLIMAIIMCSVWVILFSLTLVAFFKGKIFYAKDEDVLKDLVTAKLIDDDKEVIDEKVKAPERESAETERTAFNNV